VGNWAEDPELLATFRAEVEDRLASLSAGLLQLENHPSPKHLVAGLFRDAHTVKGSARMMGLQEVLDTAHAAEDLLGAIRLIRIEGGECFAESFEPEIGRAGGVIDAVQKSSEIDQLAARIHEIHIEHLLTCHS